MRALLKCSLLVMVIHGNTRIYQMLLGLLDLAHVFLDTAANMTQAPVILVRKIIVSQ